MKRDFLADYQVNSVVVSDDYITISSNGSGFRLDKKYGVIPKKGQVITLYTEGSSFGTIRGMDLDGTRIFYKTDEDLEAERLDFFRKEEERKQETFLKNETKMDAQYDALPIVFKKRIDRFRNNNKRFRIDFEPYELFCCEQAIIIANVCKTADEVEAFSKKEYNEQKAQVTEISDDHSGNSFSCSVHLAYWYLKELNMVYKLHGALSPLVGSDEYGDFPVPED